LVEEEGRERGSRRRAARRSEEGGEWRRWSSAGEKWEEEQIEEQ
jgi:hypothetical protein